MIDKAKQAAFKEMKKIIENIYNSSLKFLETTKLEQIYETIVKEGMQLSTYSEFPRSMINSRE